MDGTRHLDPPAFNSTTAFLDNIDLVLQMLKCIRENGDRRSATLVCKGWNDLSVSIPSWRKVCLEINSSEIEDGRWHASVATVKDILSHRKHIVRWSLDIGNLTQEMTRSSDLLTLMSHLQWLKICMGEKYNPAQFSWEKRVITITALPNLTYFEFSDEGIGMSALNVRNLPLLETLHIDNEFPLKDGLEVLECPKLVTMYVREIGMVPPSLMASLRDLPMFL